MIWQKNLLSIVSVLALYVYFLTYDFFQNPTLQYIRTFLFLGFIGFDLVKKLYEKNVTHVSEYVVPSSALGAFLLFNLRNYLDVPAKAGVPIQGSSIPKIRDFLLVLVVLFSIIGLVYQILLLLSAESEKSQTGIGKEKRTLLQNTLYSFLYISPILIGVNYLAVQRNYNFDLSAIGKYSFSDVSRSILKQVDKEIRIYAFYPRPLESSGKEESWALSAIRPDIEIYLQKLASINPKFKVEFINADVETDKLGDFPGISNGTIVVRSIKEKRIGDSPFRDEKIIVTNKKDLEDIERKLVQAVNAVTLPEKKVYFTTTNGERFGSNYLGNPSEQTTKLISILNFFNYNVSALGLNEGFPGKIPEDADVVFLAGPTVPYSEEAQKTILEFIEGKRGQVVITIDPFGKENFTWLLSKTKLQFKNETLRQQQGRPEIVATNFTAHPINETLQRKEVGVVFPYAGYFEKNPTIADAKFSDANILESGYNVFIDKNKNDKLDKEESTNNFIFGTILTIANQESTNAKESGDIKPGRIIIFSGTAWLTDRYFLYNLNPTFFTNTMNWLFQNPLIQSIIPKKEEVPVITLTSKQKVIIWSVGLFGFPGFISIVLSLYVVSIRRKKKE